MAQEGIQVDVTLSFDVFWGWVNGHPNCVLRAGTPECALYDDEDLHWHFASEEPGAMMVQLLRGKRLVGEVYVEPDQVAYVQASLGEQEGEYLFELISETKTDRFVAYYFVLSHGYEEESPFTPARVH